MPTDVVTSACAVCGGGENYIYWPNILYYYVLMKYFLNLLFLDNIFTYFRFKNTGMNFTFISALILLYVFGITNILAVIGAVISWIFAIKNDDDKAQTAAWSLTGIVIGFTVICIILIVILKC